MYVGWQGGPTERVKGGRKSRWKTVQMITSAILSTPPVSPGGEYEWKSVHLARVETKPLRGGLMEQETGLGNIFKEFVYNVLISSTNATKPQSRRITPKPE